MKKKNPTLRQYLKEYQKAKNPKKESQTKSGFSNQSTRKLHDNIHKIKDFLKQRIKEEQLKIVNDTLQQIVQIYKQNTQLTNNVGEQSIRSTRSRRSNRKARVQQINSRVDVILPKFPQEQQVKQSEKKDSKQNWTLTSTSKTSNFKDSKNLLINTLSQGIDLKIQKRKRKILFDLPPQLNKVDLCEFQDGNIGLTNFLQKSYFNFTL